MLLSCSLLHSYLIFSASVSLDSMRAASETLADPLTPPWCAADLRTLTGTMLACPGLRGDQLATSDAASLTYSCHNTPQALLSVH